MDLCSRSSPTKKKRKRSSCPTHPVLKDAVKSCVAAICSDSKKEGFFDGKELCLIQLPKHVSLLGSVMNQALQGALRSCGPAPHTRLHLTRKINLRERGSE